MRDWASETTGGMPVETEHCLRRLVAHLPLKGLWCPQRGTCDVRGLAVTRLHERLQPQYLLHPCLSPSCSQPSPLRRGLAFFWASLGLSEHRVVVVGIERRHSRSRYWCSALATPAVYPMWPGGTGDRMIVATRVLEALGGDLGGHRGVLAMTTVVLAVLRPLWAQSCRRRVSQSLEAFAHLPLHSGLAPESQWATGSVRVPTTIVLHLCLLHYPAAPPACSAVTTRTTLL